MRVWKEYVEHFADEVITDSYGSCAAKVLTQKDAPMILIEAHCDEIGMVVQHITEKGFVYVNKLGGVIRLLPGLKK